MTQRTVLMTGHSNFLKKKKMEKSKTDKLDRIYDAIIKVYVLFYGVTIVISIVRTIIQN